MKNEINRKEIKKEIQENIKKINNLINKPIDWECFRTNWKKIKAKNEEWEEKFRKSQIGNELLLWKILRKFVKDVKPNIQI